MSNTLRAIAITLILIVLSIAMRFIPFILFGKAKKTPDIINYISKVLPTAIMAFLVIYCLKDTKVLVWPFALPELIASAITVLSYLYKKNSLLSILAGTLSYMFLVQVVFI